MVVGAQSAHYTAASRLIERLRLVEREANRTAMQSPKKGHNKGQVTDNK